MNGALWVAKTGLTAQDASLRTISNNLANVSTVGFKKDRAVFQDLFYQIDRQPGSQSSQTTQLASGLQLGTGVKTVGTQKLFTNGTLQITSQSTDLAVNGRGFFQVLSPDGSLNYTRDGQFHLDPNGQLVTANGYTLEPAITIPANTQTVSVSDDGIVSVTQVGNSTPTQIGTIQIADFVNPGGLEAKGQNLFVETAASGPATVGSPGVAGMGSLKQGALENSNVNVVEELVSMISTQRAYEINSKVISTADQMLQYVNQNL